MGLRWSIQGTQKRRPFDGLQGEKCRDFHTRCQLIYLKGEGRNLPEGCWVLDPATTPDELIQACAEEKSWSIEEVNLEAGNSELATDSVLQKFIVKCGPGKWSEYRSIKEHYCQCWVCNLGGQ
ncbi:hypothetical protein LguiA_022843 [Lonicera macranthoides]